MQTPYESASLARILIADDDEDLRATLRIVFEQAGYEVEDVPDGEQAIRAQEQRPADVLITDLFMPLRDGLEIVQLFRSRYPKMWIIAISGGGYSGQKTDHLGVARAAGADASFRKPFDVRLLMEAVRASST
jgi:DNA-binding response OmpR family regulator